MIPTSITGASLTTMLEESQISPSSISSTTGEEVPSSATPIRETGSSDSTTSAQEELPSIRDKSNPRSGNRAARLSSIRSSIINPYPIQRPQPSENAHNAAGDDLGFRALPSYNNFCCCNCCKLIFSFSLKSYFSNGLDRSKLFWIPLVLYSAKFALKTNRIKFFRVVFSFVIYGGQP
ncbi:hypothetical protein Dimus_038723 [Dionaea muscipula]